MYMYHVFIADIFKGFDCKAKDDNGFHGNSECLKQVSHAKIIRAVDKD